MTDSLLPAAAPAGAAEAPYRVLARKYRPTTFAELIGQEAMVRTLSNAFATGRIAHAFILTGVRGVGKTTTARIIARALNCIGSDGKGGPTIQPCGVCVHCQAISEDRHVDVLEMDAASRTGVNDIRELLDGVRYKPVSARFKIYILDEVHMLSTQAFNALLKTLEEPPSDVKFVFATTEIRKVPVTVLSRCQRFDLRRIDAATLAQYLGTLALRENVTAAAAALGLIARAADGSARDALSLMDQAIAIGSGTILEAEVAGMLGLVDRSEIFLLFESVMSGKVDEALKRLDPLYRGGADPVALTQDLLELVHLVTRLKLAAKAEAAMMLTEVERGHGGRLAQALAISALARAWQILLKGLAEVQAAPLPLQALEMLLVRLAHAADLPSPAELVRQIQAGGGDGGGVGGRGAGGGGTPRGGSGGTASRLEAVGGGAPAPRAASVPVPVADKPKASPAPESYAEVARLFAERREAILFAQLVGDVHLVRFDAAQGRIELRVTEQAEADLIGQVGRLLSEWTGRRWVVSVSSEEGEPTLEAQRQAAENSRFAAAADHPLVKAALEIFPGARIESVRDLLPKPGAATDTPPDGGEPEGDSER
ncbi:MAG: DNA polymerase III subunit gamma/tau [Proteobacteria bacterium]|nr:DNA polymerase III subunit gamma/tau [Pseudomonadota bacterium]